MRKTLTPWLLALLVISTLAAPSAQIPDTPAGKKLSEWLGVIASGDAQKMQAFAERFAQLFLEKVPVRNHVNFFQQAYQRDNGFEVWRVEKSADYEISVLLQSKRGGDWRSLRMETEKDPPHRVTAMDYGPASATADAPILKKLSDAEVVAALEAYVRKRVEEDKFSGTVLLAKNDLALFQKAYGMADRKNKTANRIDTKFNLGSCNKMFTALAIGQLAEKGKLSLEDPVIRHLPDYPNKEVAQNVKIHHLLTHTSGLGFYPFTHGAKTPKGILKFFGDQPPSFRPGEKMQYSNAGFVVLGLIIEEISGLRYYDYIRKNIFEPAGMANTDSYALDESVPNRATGYTQMSEGGARDAGERKENYPGIEVKGSPAGGGYSTVEDMLKFAHALRGHKLLGAHYTEILLTGKQPMGPEVKYGYGFSDARLNGHRVVGHGGGAAGINAEFKMLLDSGYTIVVFSNYDPPAATLIGEEALRLIAR